MKKDYNKILLQREYLESKCITLDDNIKVSYIHYN